MDQLLSKAGSQIITFAVRSGVSIASAYVVKSVTNVMTNVPEKDRKKLQRLRDKLQTRVEIVTYAIELIQLVAARGNTGLESILKLTSDLKGEIDDFNDSIDDMNKNVSASHNKMSPKAVKDFETYMQELLSRIEQAIPIINLALTTSGANLSTGLSNKVSPGRLLQASDIIVSTNKNYNSLIKTKKDFTIQVGPTFSLTMYNIFYNPAKGSNDIIWREKMARCDVKIVRRTDAKYEYKYDLKIKENFNDGRYHDLDEDKEMELTYDLSSFQRLFFSASGKLLKLNDRSSPVLVLKINKNYGKIDSDSPAFEWLAWGSYEGNDDDGGDEEDDDGDDGDEDDDEDDGGSDKEISNSNNSDDSFAGLPNENNKFLAEENGNLSILEYLIKLCVLQANDQMSLLRVNDERLNIYLNDENSDEGNASANEKPDPDNDSRTAFPKQDVSSITAAVGKLSMGDVTAT